MKRQAESWLSLYFYAITHLLIDCICALTIYNGLIIHQIVPTQAIITIVIYDIIAFALQPVVGLFVDMLRCSRFAIVSGIVLTIGGASLVFVNALTGSILAGFGNALFHIGAGSQILNRYPSSALQAGIFVGPGAAGLSIGFWFGTQGVYPFWYLISVLCVALFLCALLPSLYNGINKSFLNEHQSPVLWTTVFLLLSSIAIRGFTGRSGFVDLPFTGFVIIGLGVAACCGKIAGGLIADRLGWITTATVSLTLSGIGIIFIQSDIWIAFATMMLFQMTMPITLIATAQSIPGRPAFAFGLTCLALITGTLTSYIMPKSYQQIPVIPGLIVVSSTFIIIALRNLDKKRKMYTGDI